MSRLEERLPCPVCLAGKMTREAVGAGRSGLALDHCERCGGVWFDGGEVAALREAGPSALLTRIRPHRETFRARCRSCEAFVSRDAEHCPVCRDPARLDCPRCDRTMDREEVRGLRIDVCRGCGGVWLDNHELKAIWKLGLTGSAALAGGAAATPVRDVGAVSAEAFLYAPDVAFLGLDAAGHALAAGAEVAALGIGPALESLGAAAETVFGLILEAIGALS